MFELSSSETQLRPQPHKEERPERRVWRPRLTRIRVRNTTSNVDTSSLFIPKLLLPKSNRPRMYSLDGYIPKPNKNRISTTSTTTTTAAPSTSRSRPSHNKSYQGLDEGSTNKRRKVMNQKLIALPA